MLAHLLIPTMGCGVSGGKDSKTGFHTTGTIVPLATYPATRTYTPVHVLARLFVQLFHLIPLALSTACSNFRSVFATSYVHLYPRCLLSKPNDFYPPCSFLFINFLSFKKDSKVSRVRSRLVCLSARLVLFLLFSFPSYYLPHISAGFLWSDSVGSCLRNVIGHPYNRNHGQDSAPDAKDQRCGKSDHLPTVASRCERCLNVLRTICSDLDHVPTA